MLNTPYDSDDVINDDDNVSVAVNEISFGRRTIHKNSTITFNATTACENVKRRTYGQNNHREKKKTNRTNKHTQYTSNLYVDQIYLLFVLNRLELYELAAKSMLCIKQTAHASNECVCNAQA